MRPLGVLVLALIISACSAAADAEGPPAIEYGRDICIECGMIITDERFAAAYWFDGERRVFDDIGGMVIHGTRTGELPASPAWVHDFISSEWIAAEQATYVFGGDTDTPMGHGIVAFATADRAAAHAAETGGELAGWGDLLALPSEGGRFIIDHDHDHDHDHESGL